MSEIHSSIVTKSIRVLDVLTQSSDPLGYTAIVAETGFSKSSAHRILAILMNEGLVEFDEVSKTYTMGPKLVGWARAAWQKTDLQLIKDMDLIGLRDQTGLNVAVSVLAEDSVMFIRTFDRQSVRYAPKIGEQSPLHCSAAGKIFLAFSESSEAESLFSNIELEKFTEHTIVSMPALRKEIAHVKEHGFASVCGEELLQVSGVAVPVVDYQSRVLAAISLWAPLKLADYKTISSQIPVLVEFGKRMSARFGQMS